MSGFVDLTTQGATLFRRHFPLTPRIIIRAARRIVGLTGSAAVRPGIIRAPALAECLLQTIITLLTAIQRRRLHTKAGFAKPPVPAKGTGACTRQPQYGDEKHADLLKLAIHTLIFRSIARLSQFSD
jgi:hypothetical protein